MTRIAAWQRHNHDMLFASLMMGYLLSLVGIATLVVRWPLVARWLLLDLSEIDVRFFIISIN